MPVCPVQTHCIKLWCNISVCYCFSFTPGKFTKKVLRVKATYFKLMQIWKCSQNGSRHWKIVSLCLKALDVWRPWTMQQYISTSKFFGGELKYKDLLFLQRNDNGSHTSYGQPFKWKSTFSNLLGSRLLSLLSSYFVVNFCMLLWNRIDPISQHSASTFMNINQLQQTSQQALQAHICRKSSALYGFNVINIFCCQW